MRISSHFRNNFLRVDDFDSGPRTLTIAGTEMERVGKDKKICLVFEEETKMLPLNKTNALALAEMYGDDTDDWAGQPCTIRVAETEFAGESVDCLRIVKARPGKGAAAAAPTDGQASQSKVKKGNKDDSAREPF